MRTVYEGSQVAITLPEYLRENKLGMLASTLRLFVNTSQSNPPHRFIQRALTSCLQQFKPQLDFNTCLAYVISSFYFVDVQPYRLLRNGMSSEEAAKDPEDPRLCQYKIYVKLPYAYTNCAMPLGLEADRNNVLTSTVSPSLARS